MNSTLVFAPFFMSWTHLRQMVVTPDTDWFSDYPNSTCLIHICVVKVTYKEWDLIMSRGTPCYPCAAGSAIRSHYSGQHVFSFMLLYTMLLHRILYNHTHTYFAHPPIRRNNLNVKQVPSWSGPHSPSFEKFGLWCFCQVAIVLSDTHGNKRTMCNLDLIITSVLHCYLHFSIKAEKKC